MILWLLYKDRRITVIYHCFLTQMLRNCCNLILDGCVGAKNIEFNMKASESRRNAIFKKRRKIYPLPFSMKITAICLVYGFSLFTHFFFIYSCFVLFTHFDDDCNADLFGMISYHVCSITSGWGRDTVA